PVSITEVRPGIFVYDMGQNFAGWAQLTVSGPSGAEVTMRYSENITTDGKIDRSNIAECGLRGGDIQTDRYILKGEETEVWEPRFTYHGFRYVEITGFPGIPMLDSLRGRVVRSAFESAGNFACSNELLNSIQKCTLWSYESNFMGIPTDCPRREKNGWTGDAMLACETGLFNFAAESAYAKWMTDFADEQRPSGQLPGIVPTGGWGYNWGSGPAWDSAYTHIPWYMYLYSGDIRILETHYSGMKRYVNYMSSMATDNILYFGLGDWCPPQPRTNKNIPPAALTSTGYYYANCRILAQAAELLGHPEDMELYSELARQIKDSFNAKFYNPENGRYADGGQAAQACALFHELVEPEEQEKVLASLKEAIAEKDNHR
ncbi:MAG TPA: alpha-rhamnosidase, partial [Armatimonadetes bacterium]|nr:alpha-rhamnosidase [Armatimonadota bacterium]